MTVAAPPRICFSILLPSALAGATHSASLRGLDRVEEAVRHPPDALRLGQLRRDLVQLVDRAAHVVQAGRRVAQPGEQPALEQRALLLHERGNRLRRQRLRPAMRRRLEA